MLTNAFLRRSSCYLLSLKKSRHDGKARPLPSGNGMDTDPLPASVARGLIDFLCAVKQAFIFHSHHTRWQTELQSESHLLHHNKSNQMCTKWKYTSIMLTVALCVFTRSVYCWDRSCINAFGPLRSVKVTLSKVYTVDGAAG